MDAPEPETPFGAISTQTTKFQRLYQSYLDKATPYVTYRWTATALVFTAFALRIFLAQGWYIGTAQYAPQQSKPQLTVGHSGVLPRHLPTQPLPCLHFSQIRPLPRSRYRYGRRCACRSGLFTPHKERSRVQAFRTETAGVQVLVRSNESRADWFHMLLERNLQSAGVLAGIGGVLVDIGVLDDEEADTEYDQVQVWQASRCLLELSRTDHSRRYVPWDFGKTKYAAK